MKAEEISCWKCGTPLPADTPLPLSRRSRCSHCKADLHACRQCRFYDTSRNNSCSEPMAERVTDKEKANFCGYFEPNPAAFGGADKTNTDVSRDKLDALFGLESRSSDLNTMGGEILSEEEAAREKLNELFGLDQDKKK